MATYGNIGLAEPSTITKSLATVSLTRNSSTVHQEIMTIGDAESSLGVASVVDSAPPSTEFGLVTRSLCYPGSSAATDYLAVRIVDSSGNNWASLGVDYTNGSTTSTLVGNGLVYNNSSNDTMRVVGLTQPLPVQLVKSTPTRNSTTVNINSSASSAFYALISSVAGVAPCVYAYAITSTAVTPMLVEFVSDTSAPKWGLMIGSASSGVTGANLAVSPPGAIFQGGTASAINVRLGSTGVDVRVSVSWFTE